MMRMMGALSVRSSFALSAHVIPSATRNLPLAQRKGVRGMPKELAAVCWGLPGVDGVAL